MENKTNEELNNLWFDFYLKELRSAPKAGFKKVDDYFLCPCCHFPTLTERNGYEICFLCFWEDDGQDDHNADKVLGGPNGSYSLTEARQNFKLHLTSYRPADTHHFRMTTLKGDIDLTVIKRQIIDKYIYAMLQDSVAARKKVFSEIRKLKL